MRRSTLAATLAAWWRQPDRYDWLIGLVESSGYGRLTRTGVGFSCLAIGAWPILMAFSPEGVTTPPIQLVTIACGVIALAFACWWFATWPTYGQSKFIVITLNASIAVNCVLYVIEDRPFTGTVAFALTASYVACVHTLPHLTVVIGLATLPIVMRMVVEATHGDPFEGAADGALRLAAVIVVPMTLRTLVQLLSDAAVESDVDPLTGLANRRGLIRAVGQLVGSATPSGGIRLCMTMVDIDDFKAINDTHGHAFGDDVLVALARMMRNAASAQAVVARIGGEEFAIVDVGETDTAVRIAEHLSSQFPAAPAPFTASIGIACTTVADRAPVDTIALTEHLLDAADHAMYTAKRAGGDSIEVDRS